MSPALLNWQPWRQWWNLFRRNLAEIRLIEKILHHLGCPKRSWYWYKTNIWGILSGVGFFHQQYGQNVLNWSCHPSNVWSLRTAVGGGIASHLWKKVHVYILLIQKQVQQKSTNSYDGMVHIYIYIYTYRGSVIPSFTGYLYKWDVSEFSVMSDSSRFFSMKTSPKRHDGTITKTLCTWKGQGWRYWSFFLWRDLLLEKSKRSDLKKDRVMGGP